MKILLIKPPYRRFRNDATPTFPLGLGYVASALLSAGHEVRIYDAEWDCSNQGRGRPSKYPVFRATEISPEYANALRNPQDPVWLEIESTIRTYAPDVVGITSCVLDLASGLMIARIAKKAGRGILVVMGGAGPTTCAGVCLKDDAVDYVVRGEGEITTVELLNAVSGGNSDLSAIQGLSYRRSGIVVNNDNRPLLPDINVLPYPAKSSLLIADNVPEDIVGRMMQGIMTSRGCPHNCAFCANCGVWGKPSARLRTAESIVDELISVRDKFHCRHFVFWDDLFTVRRKHAAAICEELLRREANVSWLCLARADTIDSDLLSLMKKAGCVQVQIGVESGSERILKQANKGITLKQVRNAASIINAAQIDWLAFIMIGLPGETEEDMLATRRFVAEIRPTMVQLTVFVPVPGSELYDDLAKTGIVRKEEFCLPEYFEKDHCYAGTMSDERFFAILKKHVRFYNAHNRRMAREQASRVYYYYRHPAELIAKLAGRFKRAALRDR